jgi:hypothetical protein
MVPAHDLLGFSWGTSPRFCSCLGSDLTGGRSKEAFWSRLRRRVRVNIMPAMMILMCAFVHVFVWVLAHLQGVWVRSHACVRTRAWMGAGGTDIQEASRESCDNHRDPHQPAVVSVQEQTGVSPFRLPACVTWPHLTRLVSAPCFPTVLSLSCVCVLWLSRALSRARALSGATVVVGLLHRCRAVCPRRKFTTKQQRDAK